MQTNESKKEMKTGAAKSASKRRLKNGGFAVAMCAVAIALVIFLNLIVGALPAGKTQLDLTSTKLYTLSDQSRELVRAVDEDVTLYFITTDNARDNTVDQLLTNYAELSDHIKVVNIDPTTNPYFIKTYTDETMSVNSVVVESAKRFRVVSYGDIYRNTYTPDMTTGQYTTVTNFDGENQLTGAIDYVTKDILPVVYVLDGNGEAALSDEMTASIERQNVTLNTLNLLTETEIPEDAAAVICVSPKNDLSDAQYDTLLAYLENGGRMLLFTDYQNGRLTRLNDLMENYGVAADNSLILEGDSNYFYPGYNYYLLPDRQEHEITSSLISGGLYVMLPFSHVIRTLDSYRSSLTIESLLTTSESAYAKEDVTSVEKQDGDETGPFSVGVAISETVKEKETRIVWYPTSLVMDSTADQAVTGSNSVLVLHSLSWVLGDEASGVVIDAKALNAEKLTLTAAQSRLWTIVMMILLPVACVIGGVVIFIRRRKR